MPSYIVFVSGHTGAYAYTSRKPPRRGRVIKVDGGHLKAIVREVETDDRGGVTIHASPIGRKGRLSASTRRA